MRFPGQRSDAETGLNYNYHRDYDVTSGRYLQADPIGLAGGINFYSYAGGAPSRFKDESGLVHTGEFNRANWGSTYCDNGEVKWYLTDATMEWGKNCPPITNCAAFHEETHKTDIDRNFPGLCAKRWYEFWPVIRSIVYDSKEEMKFYEYHAYSEELFCLASNLRRTCPNCDSSIEQRMTAIQEQLLPMVLNGTYHDL